MSVLVSFLVALAAAIITLTIVQTAAAYSSLPAQVPMGLNYDGSVRGTWPRPMIWFTVGVQLLVACVMVYAGQAIVSGAPGTHGTLRGLTITAVCVNAIIWRVQMLLISAAKSSGNAVPMRGFWLFLGACLALTFLDAFLIG